MAALPYMQFYPGDWEADTKHLTNPEKGIYITLICNYWTSGKAIRVDRAQRIAGSDPQEWAECSEAVLEFFKEKNGLLYHKRIEADLRITLEKVENSSRAGRESARVRALKKHILGNVGSTGVETGDPTDDATDVPTETQPLDKNRIEEKEKMGDKITPAPTVPQVVDLYNEMLAPPMTKMVKMSKAWEAQIRQRTFTDLPTLEHWRNFFDHCKECDFLMSRKPPGTGRTRPFKGSLHWITKADNFAKIANQEYDD